MSTDNKILLGIAAVTLVILAFGVFMLGKSGGPKPTLEDQVAEIDYSKGQKIGSDSAKVKLVEFSDFQCPSCRAAAPEVDALLNAKLDNFQFIYRHFPLSQHLNSKKAAVLAEFAGTQGKFFEMATKLFNTQPEWESLKDPTDYFVGLAGELGLDENTARQALDSNTRIDVINDDLTEGTKIGVNATPTFYLNGHKINLQTSQSLTDLVKAELAK